jgi:cytochrome c5/lysophospholipase L1-like esterase
MRARLALLSAVVVGAFGSTARAQDAARTVADGVYSDAQASRGAAAYEAACSGCHRADLSGATGPSLKEQRFARVYAGKPLQTLFTKIATTMPRNGPASLSDDVYLDIVAYVLRENGFRPGSRELTPDALDAIRVVAGRPKPPPPIGDFSYVESVGCLAAGPGHTWMLTHASEPIVVLPGAPAAASAIAAKPLGTQTFHLVDALAYAPEPHRGHKVYVRGLLVKLGDEQRMTISDFQMVSAACGDANEPADRAAPRTDQNSMTAHEQLVEKTKRGRIDVYFEGDSIVRRWGALDYPDLLANWNANFHGWNAADFGWGADRTQNILWRLEHGELDGVNPRVIVLLAGTNNVGSQPRDDRTVGEIARGVGAIVDLCRVKAPDATIVLTAIFPRNDNLAVMPTIDRINAKLAGIADGRRIRFLDVNDRLANADGVLVDGVLNERDKLHPTLKGYQIWADALKPILRELLGPPATTDLAPPPTGDPGALLRQR